jgi:hypothetical protein
MILFGRFSNENKAGLLKTHFAALAVHGIGYGIIPKN